MLMPLVLYGFT